MSKARADLWAWIKTHAHSEQDATRAVNLVKQVISEAPRALVSTIIKRLHKGEPPKQS